jgi:hypothetical protein
MEDNPLLHFTPDDITSRSAFVVEQAYDIMSKIRKHAFKGYTKVDEIAQENILLLKSNGFRLYQVVYPKGDYYVTNEKKVIYIVWRDVNDFENDVYKQYIKLYSRHCTSCSAL